MRQGRFASLGGPDTDGTVKPRVTGVRLIAAAFIVTAAAFAVIIGVAHAGFGTAISIGVAVLATMATAGLLAAAGRHIRARDAFSDSSFDNRADEFVAHVESSGQAGFWETDADGLLAYISLTWAAALGRSQSELAGTSIETLLLVELVDEEGVEPTSLAYHLGARFPFKDVVVHAAGEAERSWLLSGMPRFDEVGRFLGFRGVAAELTVQRRAAAKTSRLARFDSLTGLPNRAHMESLLEEALANAADRRQSCALFLIDLDRFKLVNDTLGHPAGDALLKEVAERLQQVIGSDGQIGRLGGDEFQAIFPGVGEEGWLAAKAERLIGIVSAPYLIHGHAVTIGASVGIAISRPGRTYKHALVKEADLALYAAKRAGRGTFRLFDPAMGAAESDRLMLETDLKTAISGSQFKLLYQPVVSVGSETLVGFEALLRWWHPSRGLLMPGDFLPIAEASGQIVALGEWIIRTVCADSAGWPEHLRVCVNVSTGQLSGDGLVAVLTSALAATGLSPHRMELEITEDALLGDEEASLETLLTIKGLGVRLCLDNFGEGAASLAGFRSVSLDRIKLHPAFLRAAAGRRNRSYAVAAALVRLAGELGTAVTATCVETLEELNLIRALGCTDVQGHLFGRPIPLDEAAALAATSQPVDPKEAARGRPPRHSLIRIGTLLADGERVSVRLRNISSGGAMVECARDFRPGALVELELADDLGLPGVVRWVHEGRVGIQFSITFDLSLLARAKREAPADLRILQPDYLRQEVKAGRRLAIQDVRRN